MVQNYLIFKLLQTPAMFHQSHPASPIRAASSGGTGAASPSWVKSLWTAGADKRIAEIQNLRDDGTSADEVLGVARDFLLPLSLLFSSVFCFLFYRKYFGEAFPPVVAIGGAVVIALLIEAGKVWFGIRALRYVYFGKPLSSIANTVLFCAVLGFASVAFYWSFSNSTSGLHDMAQSNVWQANQSEFSVNTTDIDRQINDARQAQKDAAKVKWRGTVTVDAQRTIRKQEDNIARLQDQRAKIIDQATADHSDRKKYQDDQATKAAGWTRLVGGIVEAIQLLLLAIAASCEKILSDRNPQTARRIPNTPTPPPPPAPSSGSDPYSLNGRPTTGYPHNDVPHHPTFFNRGADGNVKPAFIPPSTAPADFTSRTPAEQSPVLFKQTGDLFKQIFEDGRVVGLMYKTVAGRWQPLSLSDVRSRWNIYSRRSENKISPAVEAGREQWTWAMNQFEEGRAEVMAFEAQFNAPSPRTNGLDPNRPIADQVLERFSPLEGVGV